MNDPAPNTLESPEARHARIAREHAICVKANADIDAGLGVEDEAMEAWLDQLERDPNTTLPRAPFQLGWSAQGLLTAVAPEALTG
jgi:hypothetical protein